MARPPDQTANGIAVDVASLNRALGRAERNETLSAAKKEELCLHLRGALAILLAPDARKKQTTKTKVA